MKYIWLHAIKAYLRIGLFFYFKSIKVYNVERVPREDAFLLLSNHQNALLDALLIATKSGRFTYFLTRAGVFNKPIIAKILNSLLMIPVYRVRDGWGNISENNAIFKSCSTFLSNDEGIVIFPEGSHNLKRTVRPLSKGFTRIVLGTIEAYPELDFQLIPVGLNFSNAKAFPDSASIYFGNPINAKDYSIGSEKDNIVNLKAKIQEEISKLTTHIPSKNYYETLAKLEALNVDFLNSKAVNTCIETNFYNCESNTTNTIKQNFFLKKTIRVFTIFNLIIPFLVWKYVAKPKIKEEEFIATFRFALSITLVPLWLFLLVCILSLTLGWVVSISYLVFSILLMLLFVKW